ncbi:hypothetical protein EJ05DRAFT_472398 [Pseudovirgaria hyperparasitica]|uniref:Zinc/iron permease n=1 Tax=Pseudovirgaria hyperparasitica TaxID=470096 RepID=A0A6A6WMR2_9PEZI|nr:uncharacterized protein EJ05DRAFT_472398 [Pseudovirgaria hyperparasitica]KAF2763501.1 hypothetical protein EJ05DRAFT_472398 [Pseudovirgaria hyperparasitica]
MVVPNDTRGWIMTALSGVACIFGASIICVDVIVRMFPGKKGFRIQDSNAFLSSSLSLSFGVMIFSSLHSMLPSAKSSLQKGGLSPKAAAWVLIACFLGGVIGIQIISKILHSYIPSHVVDCAHTHEDEDVKVEDQYVHDRDNHGHNSQPHHHSSRPSALRMAASESYLPISGTVSVSQSGTATPSESAHRDTEQQHQLDRRPSLQQLISSKMSKLISNTDSCDEDDACFGFSERPCGTDCFRNIQARGGTRASVQSAAHSTLRKPGTDVSGSQPPPLDDVSETSPLLPAHDQPIHKSLSQSYTQDYADDHEIAQMGESSHHHHVPTNAFLSIGLQTSIAIALHKLPEGFITYATNHANPKLGVSVFLALFIHNITEGFAMALPLYLAIGSRWKAMFWSSLLGGVSQPLGAGIAAVWFWAAGGQEGVEIGDGVYGGMFAVTAGIMASVALQLFSEGLDLGHSRDLCFLFAFMGMAVLGASSALTA